MSATSSTRLSPSPNSLQVNEPKRYGSTLSLEEKCEQSLFLFYYYRMEDEAVLDRGASLLKHLCDEEEVEGEFTCSCDTRFLLHVMKKQGLVFPPCDVDRKAVETRCLCGSFLQSSRNAPKVPQTTQSRHLTLFLN